MKKKDVKNRSRAESEHIIKREAWEESAAKYSIIADFKSKGCGRHCKENPSMKAYG